MRPEENENLNNEDLSNLQSSEPFFDPNHESIDQFLTLDNEG